MAVRTPKIPARSTLLNSSLEGMDDLFDFKTKEEANRSEKRETGITEMDFAVMEHLPNHKFKLYTGQRLQDMVDSIREFGILEPLIIWVHDGKNTILSGHNRQNAGKLAGLTKGPVIIREKLTHEEAVLIATETNLRQRSFDDLSLSEKAYCLKQHYDAVKCQGRRNDLLKEIEELVNPHEMGENETSSEIQKKLNASEKVSEEYGLSKDKIAKYLRIATLILPLMELLDRKKIAFETAYHISFVKEENQYPIAEMIEDGYSMDIRKSALLHDYAKKGKLTEEVTRQIITGEKRKAPKSNSPKPIKIKETVISRFFDGEQSRKEIEDTIVKALELYFAQNSENKEQKVG